MPQSINQQLKQSIIWRGLFFVVTFFTTILVSRVLMAEASGEYSFFLTALTFFIYIIGFNLETAITYYISANIIKPAKFIYIIFVLTLLFYILINILFKNNYYINFINSNILQINVYQCSINYFIGIILISFSTGILNGLKDFKSSNVALILLNFVYMGFIFYRISSNNNYKIVDDFCFLTLIAGIVLYLICVVKVKFLKEFELPAWRDFGSLYKYSSYIMLSNVLFFLVYRLDYYFVNNWIDSKAATGNYLQASKFAQIMLVLPQIISATIFPQISSRENITIVNQNIARLIRLFIFLFIISLVFLSLIGRWFFPFLFGDSFSSMWLPTLILIPGILGLSISSLYSAYFNGNKQNKLNFYGACLAIVIMVGLSFIQKNNYSINKAALISTIAYFSEFSLMAYFYYKQEGDFSFKRIILVRKSDFIWFKNLIIN